MNILIISPKVPYPAIDGGAIATLSLAKNLKQSENNITFLALNTSKHRTDIKSLPSDLIDELDLKAFDVNTDIQVIDAVKNLLFSRLPYNGERFYNDEFGKVILSTIQSNKIDVVQLEGLYMCLYLNLIKEHSNVTVVLRAHNIEHIIWERNCQFEKSFFKKLYYKILANRILSFKMKVINRLDAIVPITQHDYNIFKNIGASVPMHVAYAGINHEQINLNVENNSFKSIFFIGALDWIPNQEGLKWFVENVWPVIYDKYPNEEFHIGGRNAPTWLVNYLKKPGIVFHGEVPDAMRFMKDNGIMIVPLFAGSGMRIKILEGMAAGITIISTTIGVEGISARADEEIIIADNANNFIEKICFVLENKDICKIIGQKATKFIGYNYDNLIIARKLSDFYKSIIK